jgi:hypothetical protein
MNTITGAGSKTQTEANGNETEIEYDETGRVVTGNESGQLLCDICIRCSDNKVTYTNEIGFSLELPIQLVRLISRNLGYRRATAAQLEDNMIS